MWFSKFALLMALGLISTSASTLPRLPSIPNLDFEQGPTGQLPIGWSARGALRRGFRVLVTEARPHGGRACVEIRRDSVNIKQDLGPLSRKIDARPYRGRRIRLSGWLRFTPQPSLPEFGSARLWLRVDRSGGRNGFYDDLDTHPIRSSEWKSARIIGEVASDADSIAFGPALDAYGAMWADDLSLDALGPIGEGDQPPRALNNRAGENLVAFARLLGYVRHFHPSDEAATNDWESFAIAGVDKIEGARNSADLAAKLQKLFYPLAPALRLSTRPLSPLTPAALRRSGEQPLGVTGWWHHGWAGGTYTSPYYARRIAAPIGTPGDSILSVGSEVNLEIGGGVWCSMPLTLFVDARGTLPHGESVSWVPRRPEGWIPSGNDRGTRLADVILFWNVAQHFYPYFDVVGTDWLAQLQIGRAHV